jgi:hypothetical protein
VVASDRLFVSGINQMIYHGWPYRHPDFKYPGFNPFHGAFASFIAKEDSFWDYLQHIRNLGNSLMEAGFDYAHLNEECLLKGRLEKEYFCIGHAKFRIIIIPNASTISLEAAHKCRILMDEGFPVIFTDQVPYKVPGFYEYEKKDVEVENLLEHCKPTPFEKVIKTIEVNSITPGIKLSGEVQGIQHIHRSFEGMDLYFLRSRLADARTIKVAFPMAGKGVRILNPWNGQVAEAPSVSSDSKWLEMELPMGPYGSTFLLFGNKPELPDAEDKTWLTSMKAAVQSSGIAVSPESWDFRGVSIIPEDNGKEICLNLKELKDWVELEELKFFSGKGTYRADFNIEEIPEGSLVLDLGRVGDAAEIVLNGTSLPVLLAYPYTVDVTGLVKEGENSLLITITNCLRNGLVGHKSFKSRGFGPSGTPNAQRQRALSGLIGPVTLKTIQ